MSIVEKIREKPAFGGAVAGGLVLIAVIVLAYTYWPQHQARLDQTFLSADDGKTWYADSIYLVPPVQHDGKEAVFAQIYTYANGSKQFCASLIKFTPEGKQKLDAALQTTLAANKPAGATPLYADRQFINGNRLVKKPGAGEWVPFNDPRANAVMTPTAPDGSVVDQVLP